MATTIPRGSTRAALFGLAIACAAVFVLLSASGAQAAERIYWDNYNSTSAPIAFANADGSGGGPLNADGAEIGSPEGLSYDPVTNRIYVANTAKETISYVNLDGSGGGSFVPPGSEVDDPEGIAVDSASRTVYWLNTGPAPETIWWARLDGSASGQLPTNGSVPQGAYRIALDPVGGRIYWSNGDGTMSYTNVNGTGGGTLNVSGAAPPSSVGGLAVDNAAGRLYWADSSEESLSYANLDGSGGRIVETASETLEDPYGLALDTTLGKLYWGNYDASEGREIALGFANAGGGGGGFINVLTAPVAGPQDPVVIRSPSGTGAPSVTRSGTQLSCSQGSWAADSPGSSFFQAPRSYAYQWTLNGVAIAGATVPTLAATTAGVYGCVVTGTNELGSVNQTSATATVKAATLAGALTKKKLKSKPGKVVKVPVTVANQGDLSSAATSVCLQVPKKAKKALKPGKCQSLAAIVAGGSAKATLTLKVKKVKKAKHGKHRKQQSHSYKLSVAVPGQAPIAVSLKVSG